MFTLKNNVKEYILHYISNALHRSDISNLGSENVILNSDSMKPIYIQISEWLETEILRANLKEGERIYSQYQLAEMFNINPATAAKGLNILVDETIAFKKRGLGLFVAPNAKQFILQKRRSQVLKQMINELVLEAKHLDVKETELMDLIHQVFNEIEED